MKLPAIQFYTGDWLKDPGVRAVSLAARGLWMDMLCLMSEASPRGYLKLNGKPVSPALLARMTGGTADEVSRLLQELETAGVYSQDRHGVIYSRRIVKDEEIRQTNRRNGRLGGNPVLLNKPDNPPVNRQSNPDPTPSSSSSVSTSPSGPPSGEDEAQPPGPPPEHDPPAKSPRREASGPHAELIRHFVAGWKVRYGREYPFGGKEAGRNGRAIKTVLEAAGGRSDEAKAVLDRYLASDDYFHNGHPLTLLASESQLPRFLVEPRQPNGQRARQSHPQPKPPPAGQFPQRPRQLPRLNAPAGPG